MKTTMKKWLCVLLSVLMVLSLFSGCNQIKNAVEFAEIAAANSTKKLLESYDSILVTFVDLEGAVYGYYMDDEIGYYWRDAFTDDDGTAYDAYYEVTTETYQAGMEGDTSHSVLYAGGEIDTSWFENVFVNPEIFVLETLEDTVEQGDLITYHTTLSIVDLVDMGYMAEADTINNYYVTEYTVEADTLHFHSIKETFCLEDGTPSMGYTCTVEYNAPRPETADAIIKAREEASEVCTVSVVKDMDTDEESTETFTIPKGDILYFYWYGDYESVYTNRECTEDFEDGSLVNEDMTIYLK